MGKITIDKKKHSRLLHLTNEDNFFALSLSDEIKSLASPLVDLGITYFNQIRIFNDGSRISVGTHADWLNHFFKNRYYLKGRFSKKGAAFKVNDSVLWKTQPDDGVAEDARSNFNIDNGFTIIKHANEYNDFFLFASTRENEQINQFYLSQRDVLEQFIAYFQDKSEFFLNKCSPDKPFFIDEYNTETKIPEDQPNLKITEFYKLINPKKFYIYNNGIKIKISSIEYVCLQLLIKDKTIKELAQIIGNQPSTCYRHIENLKARLNLCSTAQLIKVAKENYC